MNPLPDDHNDGPSRIAALFGLIVVAPLVAAALVLVHALRQQAQREDCLLSGRTNCAPIALPPR